MAADVVDWDFASATARRLAGPGPQIPLSEARAAVADLRACAQAAVDYVATHTGLEADPAPDAVAVVDRPGWIRANATGFAAVLDPVVARLRERREDARAAGLTTAVGSRVVGAEVGLALGFLGSKVLGQYELFTAQDAPPRLLLVAPNIVHVERELEVDPHDFRLWVCLHEETHRVQFTAVPWLAPWLKGQVTGYVEAFDVDPAEFGRRARQAVGAVVGAARGLDAVGVLEQLMTPEEREVMDRLTAVMSLLEGHADVVMDGVGPAVVPSVETIRSRFSKRRTSPPAAEAFVRRLLGVDTKLKQYRDGAAFVRAVIESVGMSGFNRVWESPASLPSRTELHDPARWLARVHSSSSP
ncbi:MAG: zinc-dependent metalloprotease [Actinomycetota bacterium]|nr:zinc-dependent metalloprotease [Actinomycetota bacterium]